MKTKQYYSFALIIGVLFCWLLPINGYAEADVEVDGIYYDLNTSDKTATVTYEQA